MLPIYRDDFGHDRPLGHVPPVGRPPVAAPLSPGALLDPARWEEFELDPGDIRIKDQDGKGACNGHAAATDMEWARRIAGMPHVPLSAWYVYAILCNGWDRGSNIGDALRLCTDRGVCLEPSVPYATINPRRIPEAAHAEAKRFRIEIGAKLEGFDALMTATQLRQPFNFSLCVGRGFDQLSAEGVVGYSRGAGNHAICGGLGAKRLSGGEWAIKFANSWGTRWGQGGYAWFTRRHVEEQGWFEAYSISAATDDPQDDTRPPAVTA